MGKSRVDPSKITAIPRLQLTAAVVSAKIGMMIQEELNYENLKQYYWTDSKVVLGYINNEAKRFIRLLPTQSRLSDPTLIPKNGNTSIPTTTQLTMHPEA